MSGRAGGPRGGPPCNRCFLRPSLHCPPAQLPPCIPHPASHPAGQLCEQHLHVQGRHPRQLRHRPSDQVGAMPPPLPRRPGGCSPGASTSSHFARPPPAERQAPAAMCGVAAVLAGSVCPLAPRCQQAPAAGAHMWWPPAALQVPGGKAEQEAQEGKRQVGGRGWGCGRHMRPWCCGAISGALTRHRAARACARLACLPVSPGAGPPTCARLPARPCCCCRPFMVKNHIWVFVNAQIENPAFDSQV